MKSYVNARGKREIIFCRKWVALGCWARAKKAVFIESVIKRYYSSVVKRVIRV
jgi:hypothetical protein